jgi:folylpolyglutamate synthase/dihydropteroate synthase
MVSQTKRTRPQQDLPGGLQKSYSEITQFLDKNWSESRSAKNIATFKQLDQALGSPLSTIKKVVVSGSNGKSLTMHFAGRLLNKEEGLIVGSFSSPHLLHYNERISVNSETIANKPFAELANEVINTAELHALEVDSLDILTMIALLYFKQLQVDIVLLEIPETSYHFNPLTVYTPDIFAVTRLTNDMLPNQKDYPRSTIASLFEIIGKKTYVVSGDQSKAHLQIMNEKTKELGGTWAMPIRKLAQLPYPYEQLHGRCAALAERIAQIYIENFVQKEKLTLETSLLAKQKGQRGRPTLEAKRQSELNPKRTVEQFWKETTATLPARFELLDKEKPTILLDNASNIDAVKNLFLGIRLLHYQRPLKGLTFIFGCDKNSMLVEEFLKHLRYFYKKNSAQVIFCPIKNMIPGLKEETWDIEKITNDVKGLKIKARTCSSFAEGFEAAKESVDERHGLVVITGSNAIITEYWNYKGLKKI